MRTRELLLVLTFFCGSLVRAQGNYEIQVYGSDAVAPDNTMVELHSNFTVNGQRLMIFGVYPTFHQEHESIEITQDITDWSEVGFYTFTSEQNGHGVQWVGDHIRPRVRSRMHGIGRLASASRPRSGISGRVFVNPARQRT